MIDLFSFFACYRSVEYFLLYGCIIPLSEITDTVWANLPSRQQPNIHQPRQSSIHHRPPHGTISCKSADLVDGIFGEYPGHQQQRHQHIREGGDTTAAGVSYACSHIRSALDNPYALDMLNWIASMETDSDEVMNWIVNAKNCGWPGLVETGADDTSTSRMDIGCKEDMTCSTNDQIIDDLLEDYQVPVDVVHSDAVEHHRTCTYEAIRENESYYPERRRISAEDDDYLRNTVSHEAYYDFIRSPHPKFYDSVKEHGFWFVTTVICFGFLYIYDIPFLLI